MMRLPHWPAIATSIAVLLTACGGSVHTSASDPTEDAGGRGEPTGPARDAGQENATRSDASHDGAAHDAMPADAPADAPAACAACKTEHPDGASAAYLGLYDCYESAACQTACASLISQGPNGDWPPACVACIKAAEEAGTCENHCTAADCRAFSDCIFARCQ